jgi:prepilin peptidase CpaA
MTVGHVSAWTGSPSWRLIGGVVFFGLLALACAFDIWTRRIPNWLVVILAVTGILINVATAPRIVDGLVASLGGVVVGLLIWLPSWLFRLLGAGDVKMFAAASAWLGMHGAFEGAIFAAFAGGALAFLWMLWYRGLRGSALTIWAVGVHPRSLIQPMDNLSTARALPYTLALAVGAGVAALHPHLLF